MISKKFIKELAKMTGITDKAILKYPITTLNSDAVDIIVNIDASKLDCSGFEDTGIYELNKFIHTFGLFNDPEIKRTENSIEFQTPGQKSIFTVSDISLMESYNQKSEIIEILKNFPSVAEVDLKDETIKKFKQASSIFNELNVLTIEGKDGDTALYLDAHNRFNSSNNVYQREFLNTSKMNFKHKINIENFNKLPSTDYKLLIKYNEEKQAFRIVFVAENFKILISRITD